MTNIEMVVEKMLAVLAVGDADDDDDDVAADVGYALT